MKFSTFILPFSLGLFSEPVTAFWGRKKWTNKNVYNEFGERTDSLSVAKGATGYINTGPTAPGKPDAVARGPAVKLSYMRIRPLAGLDHSKLPLQHVRMQISSCMVVGDYITINGGMPKINVPKGATGSVKAFLMAIPGHEVDNRCSWATT
ncbi:uncharacterized protein PpBr36_10479 [Pyricularia pennisetigena]|uniref:uncharacterized protein n=1 Tax=Pyricularia pennisetigena TaxID=1578925 RepID=UPI00115160A3|nr:uncharacterized protein PpBr36_10479 [Pyricularia pennisetigena]TLS21160.1 hypothetical protein PpBr36_10479 [Pyricularia pennisetigena]